MALTVHQRRIVQTKLPYVEVVAKPGSGKTTTLMQRLAHLVRCGISVRKILVLSFSNEAVGEIGRRLVGVYITDILCPEWAQRWAAAGRPASRGQ